jgi:hypothetical protein
VNGAAAERNAALTSAYAELKRMDGWSIAGAFEVEFPDVMKSCAGKGMERCALRSPLQRVAFGAPRTFAMLCWRIKQGP